MQTEKRILLQIYWVLRLHWGRSWTHWLEQERPRKEGPKRLLFTTVSCYVLSGWPLGTIISHHVTVWAAFCVIQACSRRNLWLFGLSICFPICDGQNAWVIPRSVAFKNLRPNEMVSRWGFWRRLDRTNALIKEDIELPRLHPGWLEGSSTLIAGYSVFPTLDHQPQKLCERIFCCVMSYPNGDVLL